MGNSGNPPEQKKPFTGECCGAYCEEAGCCQWNYYPHDSDKRDPNTEDLFPDYYVRPGNPDVDNS